MGAIKLSEIGIFNETEEEIEELKEISKLCDFLVKKETEDNVEFNVIIINNEAIRNINKEYRNIDRETDVISFALEDLKDVEYEGKRLLGDIYISIEKAREQAESYGHSLLRELAFLTTHGFLHLLGYDHMNEEDEKVMFKKQEELLDEYGIKRS